jgi:hypothetical protein
MPVEPVERPCASNFTPNCPDTFERKLNLCWFKEPLINPQQSSCICDCKLGSLARGSFENIRFCMIWPDSPAKLVLQPENNCWLLKSKDSPLFHTAKGHTNRKTVHFNQATHLKSGVISRTNADSQWNPVYNAFPWNFCCRNETIRR